nr:hypothetical protein HAGR004_26590 [Bdellovibrio sp. HAGR004]
MYRETSPSLDMRNSAGMFDVPIGTGTKIFPAVPSFKLLDVFENTGTFNCEGGGTYSPAVDDKRLLRVQFFDGIGWRLISPDSDIRSVPFAAQAKVAQSAHRLGSLQPSDVLDKASIPLCSAGQYLRHLAPAGTFVCEAANVSGANVSGNIAGSAAGFSGSLIGDVSGSQSATSVDRIKGTPVVNTGLAAGKVLKFDGTNWSPADDNSGTAGAITSLTGDVTSSGSPTATVTLGNDVVTSAKVANNSILNEDIAAGAAIADSKLATISTAGKVSGSAITSGTIAGTTAINTSGLIQTSNGLRVYSGTNYVELKAPAGLSADSSYQLPVQDGTAGQVLTTNGSGVLNWSTVTSSGGTVTGVTANAPLASSGGTAPVLSLNDSGVGAGTYAKVTVSTKGLVTGGSALSNTDIPNLSGDVTSTAGSNSTKVEKIQGISVDTTTPSLGQVLLYDSTKWNVQYFGFGQLRSTVTGNAQMPVSCATANKTLNWSAITDTFTCVDIAIANTQVSGLGSAAAKNFGTTAGNLVELDGTARIPASLMPSSYNNAIMNSGNSFGANMMIGTNDANDLAFETNNSVALTIRNGGNVGIGVTNPTKKLQVNGDAEVTNLTATTVTAPTVSGTTLNGSLFFLDGTAAGWVNSTIRNQAVDGYSGISFVDNSGNNKGYIAYANSGAGITPSTVMMGTSATTVPLTFSIGGNEAMRIAASTGNVGIGTSSPEVALHLVGNFKAETTEGYNVVESRTSSEANFSPHFLLRRSRGTTAAPTYVQTGDTMGLLTFRNHTATQGATVYSYATENHTASAWGANLTFSTIPNGSNINTPRMTIDQNGNVGVGNTSPTYKVDVTGDINSTTRLRIAGTQVCTSAGCTSSSDLRLKEEIQPLEHSLKNILNLQAVSYVYKDHEKFGGKRHIGVIAQDIEQVYPEVVVTDPSTGFKSVAYDHLVAPLIEAVKSLHGMLQGIEQRQSSIERQLASEIESLKAENAAKDREVRDIKAYLCQKDPGAPVCH